MWALFFAHIISFHPLLRQGNIGRRGLAHLLDETMHHADPAFRDKGL